MLFTSPDRANTLVPLLPSVPDAGIPLAAVPDDLRDVGEGFDVVQDRRFLPEPLERRERRTRTRHAAFALDRAHQSGFFAAYEGPRSLVDVDVEVEPGSEDVLSEQAVVPRLPDGDAQAANGERIFGPGVDVALVRVDGAGRDDHPLENGVGVGLEHAAVHERAGVALVGIAQHDT